MIESCMNLRSASFALAILLIGILSHSIINSSFAQTVPNRDNVPAGAPPTDTGSNLKSPMHIARDAANAGMKTVTDKMKTEKGMENQTGIQQKNVGSVIGYDDKKMKHFEQI